MKTPPKGGSFQAGGKLRVQRPRGSASARHPKIGAIGRMVAEWFENKLGMKIREI